MNERRKQRWLLVGVSALVVLAGLSTAAGAAEKKTVAEVMDEITQLVEEKADIDVRLETNLSRKRANEAAFTALEEEQQRHEAEDVAPATRYCSGEFPEPEYSRRVAWCAAKQVEFDAWGRRQSQEKADLRAAENERVDEAKRMAVRYRGIEARIRLLQGHLGTLRIFAGKRCDGEGSLEAAHHCLQTIWDGAKASYRDDPLVVKPPWVATPR